VGCAVGELEGAAPVVVGGVGANDEVVAGDADDGACDVGLADEGACDEGDADEGDAEGAAEVGAAVVAGAAVVGAADEGACDEGLAEGDAEGAAEVGRAVGDHVVGCVGVAEGAAVTASRRNQNCPAAVASAVRRATHPNGNVILTCATALALPAGPHVALPSAAAIATASASASPHGASASLGAKLAARRAATDAAIERAAVAAVAAAEEVSPRPEDSAAVETSRKNCDALEL